MKQTHSEMQQGDYLQKQQLNTSSMMFCSEFPSVKNRGMVSIQCKNKDSNRHEGKSTVSLLKHATFKLPQSQNSIKIISSIATTEMAECMCYYSCLNLVYCLQVWMVWIPAPERRRIQCPRHQFRRAVGMRVGWRSHVVHKLVTSFLKSCHIRSCQDSTSVHLFSLFQHLEVAKVLLAHVELILPPAIFSWQFHIWNYNSLIFTSLLFHQKTHAMYV